MFKFPFGTMNELNLDWIITKVRELIDTAGITKEKITFETPNGDVQFDGSEAVTIDVQGVDTSGKLDKYTGGTDSIYGTLGSNQVNFPVPLPAERGGTGVTSLPDLETSMNLSGKYVARNTTAGLAAYAHEGSTERTIPIEITPNPAGIPYRDANGNVRTNTPDNNNDAATKKYVDDADANKLDKLTTANESVYSHNGNTQGEIATATANTASTIVKRDASGRAQFEDPSSNQDAATKKYVDDSISSITNVAVIQFTPAAGWVIDSGDTRTRCKVRNGIASLELAMRINKSEITIGNETVIGSIPSQYAPTNQIVGAVGTFSDSTYGSVSILYISNNGEVTAVFTSLGTPNNWVWGNLTWLVGE